MDFNYSNEWVDNPDIEKVEFSSNDYVLKVTYKNGEISKCNCSRSEYQSLLQSNPMQYIYSNLLHRLTDAQKES